MDILETNYQLILLPKIGNFTLRNEKPSENEIKKYFYKFIP